MADGALPVGTAKDRLAEMVAVGFPPAMFINPNFAEDVLVAPSKRSSVIFVGEIALLLLCQYPEVPVKAAKTLSA